MTYRKSPLADVAPGAAEVVTQWDGQTMGGRVPAFIGLAQKTGGVFYEDPPDVQTGMQQAGMDFEVQLHELQAVVPELGLDQDGKEATVNRMLPLAKHRSTVGHWKDGSRLEAFGPVGSRYEPIQPSEQAELGQFLVDGGSASLKAIGTYGQPFGCHTYMAFDLGSFTIGGQDAHQTALTLVNHHDGSGGLVIQAAPVRVSCTNQVAGIFGRRQKSRYVVRHTTSAKAKISEIRAALGMVAEYVDTYQEESELLLAQALTTDEFVTWERELFEGNRNRDEFSDRELTMAEHRDEALLGIWRSDTSEFGRGTGFAAAQSVIEYLDHESIVRGRDPERARMERILAGTTEATKAKAWASFLS
jgi:phage/plasmid-like protein (TIGR03299 family)